MTALDALLPPVAEVATTSRERWKKWEATHSAVKALKVGESHRATPSFSVHRVAATGDRQYRVTMKGPRQGPNAGDRHVYMASPRGATRAALGYSDRSGRLRHDDGMSLLLPPLAEAADSMAKASTPEPFSSSRTSNWVARAGGLPPYIQHIAHDLMEKRGKTESNAIEMAIGIVKNWASGKGKVDANTRAAAAKAVAQWEAMKGKNAAKGAARAVVQHAEPSIADTLALAESAEQRIFTLARAIGPYAAWELITEHQLFERDIPKAKRMELAKKGQAFPDGSFPMENQGDVNNAARLASHGNRDRGRVVALIKRVAKKLQLKVPETLTAAAESGPTKLKCPKCDTVQRASNSKCTNCGHDLADARKAKMAQLNEQQAGTEPMQQADAAGSWSPTLKRAASSTSETQRFEVHDDGQHVGYVSQRTGYSPREPARWRAHSIKGDTIHDGSEPSKHGAITALRRHLAEAPSRISSMGSKFLVARPASYSGPTTYEEYPSEQVARHAAGLPPNPTAPEKAAAVTTLAECVAADLALIEAYAPDHYAELWEPTLRRHPEGDGSGPFASMKP